MGLESGSIYCEVCRRQAHATRTTPNHVLHLLLTLLVCGAWLPVWLLVSLTAGRWTCTTCGWRRSSPLAWIGLAGLVAFGLLVSYLWIWET